MQDYCRRIPSRAHKLRTIPSTYPVRPHPRKLWSSTVTATDGGPMGDGNVSTTEPVELAQEAPSPRAQAPPTGWQRTFAALRHRNYRLWFQGQLVSMVGTWMQVTAQGFLVFQLTHSTAYLGYVGFAAGLPSWLFMLYGGVIADRVPRRNLLVITQTMMMILAFILAGLTFSGLVQPWHI